LADVNEDIMEKYLGGEELSVEELKAAIRQATCDVEFYPALCGTAFKNKGVQLLLNAVVDYLPSPLDVKPIVGNKTNKEEEEKIAKQEDSKPFEALAFKVMTDPNVVKLTFSEGTSVPLMVGLHFRNIT